MEEPKQSYPAATLDDIDRICGENITVKFIHRGREVSVPCRKLTPKEDAEITAIVQRVRPKMIAGPRPGEQVPDLSDPQYQEAIAKASLSARSLTLYIACPWFASKHPGLSMASQEQITAAVQSHFTEEILGHIFSEITAAEVNVEDRVNFTLTPASPQS